MMEGGKEGEEWCAAVIFRQILKEEEFFFSFLIFKAMHARTHTHYNLGLIPLCTLA